MATRPRQELPAKRSRAAQPGQALAFVIFALVLLAVVPLVIGNIADVEDRAVADRLSHVRAQVGDVRSLLVERLRFAELGAATHQPRYASAAEGLSPSLEAAFQRLVRSCASLGGPPERAARSAYQGWRASTAPGRSLARSAADLASVASSMDVVAARVDDGRARAAARTRALRGLQFDATVVLAMMAAFASSLVFRAQRHIERNAVALDVERGTLAAVYASVDVGIALWDPAAGRLDVNPAGTEILGMSAADVSAGLAAMQRLDPRLPDGTPVPPSQAPAQLAASGRRFHNYELLVTREDGEDLNVLFSGGPIEMDGRDGGPLGVVVFRDVTRQRASERKLHHLALQNARRVRELEAIIDTSRELSLEGGSERLSGFLTERVALLFNAEKCAIWLYDPDSRTLRPCIPAYGIEAAKLEGVQAPVTPGSEVDRLLRADEPLLSRRLEDDPRLEQYRDMLVSLGARSVLAVRLAASGKPLGFLAVYNRRDGAAFTDDEAGLLSTFAGQAAFVQHSTSLYQEASRRAELLAWAMQETHHRIKNNLQVVSAILDIQALDARDDTVPVETLREVLRQIRTIAVVHDLLSHRDQWVEEGAVSARTVVEHLVPVVTMGRAVGRIQFHLDVEDFPLPEKIPGSLGLVLTELVSNAIKHASANPEAEVWLSLGREGDAICMVVQDSGPGFAADFDVRSQTGVGLGLVKMLVERDLSGHLRFLNAPGGRVEVQIPLKDAVTKKDES